MRAWRVHEYGEHRDALVRETCEPPALPARGARVEVAAAGLNFPDLLSIAGRYQVRAPLPFVPGLEAVGRVAEVGAASERQVGERVIVSGGWGAFADVMAGDDDHLFPVPDTMPDADAAALFVTYQTGYFALVHRAQMRAGETLLVHGGAGGVGTAAIQLGVALGARVLATASSPEKQALCRELGADEVIPYRDVDFAEEVKRLTGGRGADVIYDPVGGDIFDRSTKCIAFGGRLLVIGFASGRIPEIAANRILIKNIAVVGLHWGNYFLHDPGLIRQTHDELVKLYRQGRVQPVVGETLPMERLPDALSRVAERRARGKIVVVNA